VILQAAHPEYAGLDYGAIEGCEVVLDGRNALDRAAIEAAGLRYVAIGQP
jgi:UDP-N-acetyl-D-mannosaminuronic acid dehydrogenase